MESLEIILRKANKTYSGEEKELLANKKNELYKKYLENLTPNDVSDDVLSTLKQLKEKGVKLAIGSSSKNTKLILNKIGIFEIFDAIVDGNNISNSKPHPEVFLKAAECINLDVKECLVIEDAFSGIDAAYAGGFKSCGIGQASTYEKATYKIKSVKDIINLL